jgi:hypothetical protein
MTAGQSVCLSWCQSPIWGPRTDLCYCENSCGFVDVGRQLWREDWSVIYCCCWSSPAQSRSGLSPAGLKIILHYPNSWDSPNLDALSQGIYRIGTDLTENTAPNSCIAVADHCVVTILLFIQHFPGNEQCSSSRVTVCSHVAGYPRFVGQMDSSFSCSEVFAREGNELPPICTYVLPWQRDDGLL